MHVSVRSATKPDKNHDQHCLILVVNRCDVFGAKKPQKGGYVPAVTISKDQFESNRRDGCRTPLRDKGTFMFTAEVNAN
ncbi:hypothetical protein M8J75_014563 [Diaphorina citri]|nr:hypothetical protein M8J75_014563 [Diaphorina citri]